MTWEKQYLNLLNNIYVNGEDRADRTGTGTRALFGQRLDINLKDGFPAMTSKKLAWKAVVSELLWFLEGSSNERRLAEILHGTNDREKKTPKPIIGSQKLDLTVTAAEFMVSNGEAGTLIKSHQVATL